MNHRLPECLRGQLLVAMPGLGDPNFFQTVTYLSEHTEQGAVGIVLNRVHPVLKGQMIFNELGIEHTKKAAGIPIHTGGPVHVNEIYILHGSPFEWESTLRVDDNVALSNSMDILKAIAMDKGPDDYILALGCAGWGGGQLEGELQQNVWLTMPASDRIVFKTPLEMIWEEAMKKMGIDPLLLSDEAGHA